jgi:hypothetical protein
MHRTRSKNPDLLFPDVMAERATRAADFWAWRIGRLARRARS